MSVPEVNVPLLRKAVEWAEAEAARGSLSEWVQAWWRTTPDAEEGSWESRVRGGIAGMHAPVAPECGTTYCIAGFVCHQIGEEAPADWMGTAAKALGIAVGTASALFHASNTIEDVRRIAESLAGERL